MVVQGSNSPIVLTLDDSVEDVPKLSVGLYSGSTCLKQWNKDDVTIDGGTITCPLTQEETATFQCYSADLAVKILSETGDVILYEVLKIAIGDRPDRGVVL